MIGFSLLLSNSVSSIVLKPLEQLLTQAYGLAVGLHATAVLALEKPWLGNMPHFVGSSSSSLLCLTCLARVFLVSSCGLMRTARSIQRSGSLEDVGTGTCKPEILKPSLEVGDCCGNNLMLNAEQGGSGV